MEIEISNKKTVKTKKVIFKIFNKDIGFSTESEKTPIIYSLLLNVVIYSSKMAINIISEKRSWVLIEI